MSRIDLSDLSHYIFYKMKIIFSNKKTMVLFKQGVHSA